MDKDHEIGKHPEDYSLFRIATYDDNTSTFVDEDPECLITGMKALSEAREVNGAQLRMLDEQIGKEAVQ